MTSHYICNIRTFICSMYAPAHSFQTTDLYSVLPKNSQNVLIRKNYETLSRRLLHLLGRRPLRGLYSDPILSASWGSTPGSPSSSVSLASLVIWHWSHFCQNGDPSVSISSQETPLSVITFETKQGSFLVFS